MVITMAIFGLDNGSMWCCLEAMDVDNWGIWL